MKAKLVGTNEVVFSFGIIIDLNSLSTEGLTNFGRLEAPRDMAIQGVEF